MTHDTAGNITVNSKLLLHDKEAVPKTVQSILELGDGETALHLAAIANHRKVDQVLLKWPFIDIDARDGEGCTALFKAADRINKDSILSLLSYGADINIPNSDGLTALDIVAVKQSSRDYELMRDELFSFNDSYNWNPQSSDWSYEEYFSLMFEFKAIWKISKILGAHAVKLKIAGLYVCEENLPYIDCAIPKSRFVTDCEEEVVKLKNVKVGSSGVSYYDVLTKSNNELAYISQNSVICHVLNTEDCEDEFPLYGHMVKFRFKRAEERLPLLEKVIPALVNIFGLPELSVHLITNFLCNADLKKCFDCV